MDREEQNRLILAELARLYPDARPALHFANPFELLVAVMLSAQCTDVKVNMVTPARCPPTTTHWNPCPVWGARRRTS